MTGYIRESEYEQMREAAHARGEHPPLICARAIPDAEYDARFGARPHPMHEAQPEAG